MTRSGRVVVLPREVASGVITTALARGAWGVSLTIIALTFPVVIDVAVDRGFSDDLAIPILALAAFFVLLLLAGAWPRDLTRVLLLVGGSVLAYIYGITLLASDPSLNGEAGYLLNRPLLVLVLVGAGVRKPIEGFAWAILGFALANAVALAISLHHDVPFAPGWGPTLALAMYAAAFLAVAVLHSTQSKHIPDLAKLEADTRRMDLENQFEQRAAAIVHDTVLSDLTVVMNSGGMLDDRARERLRADVATLADPTWLRESAPDIAIAREDARLRNAIVSLVSEFQWRGLTVDVADESDEPAKLSPPTEALLVAAIRACLDNVLRHARTSQADLIVSAAEGFVSVMVVDNGIGFDPDAVATDRLGIRTSVRSRIQSVGGTVRIWSTPGAGTSVFLSVPFDCGEGDDE